MQKEYEVFRDDLLLRLNKHYGSLEDFSANCSIDIYSIERDNYDSKMPSSQKRYNIMHFLSAFLQEEKYHVPFSEENSKTGKICHPISSAIALKLMMPYIAKELRVPREFDGVMQTLQEHFVDDKDAIFTDCYLNLNIAINNMDFKKFASIEDPEEQQKALCGYLKFYCFEVIQNYTRANISKGDYAHGRREDYFIENAHNKDQKSTTHKMGIFIPGETLKKRVTILETQKFAVHNEIVDELNRNDELEFKQARILKYLVDHDCYTRISNPSRKPNKGTQKVFTINETTNLQCFVKDDKREVKSYGAIINKLNDPLGKYAGILDAVKSLDENACNDIIAKFNISEFKLDSYYHGLTTDAAGYTISTSMAYASHLFNPDEMEYKEDYAQGQGSTKRKPTVHTEEFYKKHPNYKRPEEKEIEDPEKEI